MFENIIFVPIKPTNTLHCRKFQIVLWLMLTIRLGYYSLIFCISNTKPTYMLRSKHFVNIEKTSAHARRDTGQEFELWVYLIFIQLRSQIHCYNLAENCVKHWCTHRSTILVGIPYPLLENRTWYYHSGTGTGSHTVTDPIVEAAGAGLSQPKLWGRMSGATSNKRGTQ